MLRHLSLGLVSLLAIAAAGCGEENPRVGLASIPARDDKEFVTAVLPILLRDCGFQACHGSQERFFRVYGPGRTRLPSTVPILIEDPKTDGLQGYERDYTMQLARSMIDPDNPADSLLLRKPLAVEAGGAAHEGVDKYGRNVYRTPGDDGYRKLARWVFYIAPTMAAAPPPVVAGAAGAAALAP